MNRKIKILLSIIISIFVILLTNNVYAASANLSAKNTNLEPGQSTSITVSVSATEAWNLKLSSTGGNLSGNLASADAMGSEVSQNVITASFSSSSEGSYVITLSGQITGSDLVKQQVSKSITINVKAKEPVVTPNPEPDPVPEQKPEPDPVPEQKPDPEPGQKDPDLAPTTKSSEAILYDLGIRPKEYDFTGFSSNRNKGEWYVTVPNEVTRVEVYASPWKNGKVISGTGWKNLKDIRTPLEVVVQSEDGTKTKTYTIYVTRDVEEGEITPNTNENVDVENENDITVGLSKLEVTGLIYSPEFETNVYKYTIEGKLDDFNSVEEFKSLIVAEANFEGAKIEITSEETEFKVGRNKILITVKDTDGREIAIYTIVLKLTEKEETVIGKTDENKNKDKNVNINIEWNKLIVLFSIALMAVYSIIISVISYKQRKILELNGLVESREDDDYNPFEEIKTKQEKSSNSEKIESVKKEIEKVEEKKVVEETEEEIRRRKIDEFLRGRESKH